MKTSEYWTEYMRAVEAGEYRKSLAERVGLTPQAVWTRTYDKRRLGYDIPQLPTSRGNLPHSEFAEIMAKHGITRTDSKKSASKPAAKKSAAKKTAVDLSVYNLAGKPNEDRQEKDSDLPDSILELLGGAD